MSHALVALMRTIARYGYVPLMLIGVNALAIWIVTSDTNHAAVVLVLIGAVLLSFAVERLIPYRDQWNGHHDDSGRDSVHAFVNETLILLSVAAIPALAAILPTPFLWPTDWPFVVQVLAAVAVADFGITAVHLASHRIDVLWRFHAVHHSITRFYGMNGLMKHPLHQTVEMAAGVAPLILLGIPVDVASILALAVAVQLLLQHSNADYRVGPAKYVLALNEGHRFHHLKWAGVGDVNFGLFTLVWDHAFHTFSYDPNREFSSDVLGMAAKPNYPVGYVEQLTYPFSKAGGCTIEPLRELAQPDAEIR